MAGQDTVRIQRLRLRASEAERRAALTELEQASWPDGGRDWILVRQLHVRAPRASLGMRAAAQAHRAVAAAVSPAATGAAQAPAVRFASLTELLAHLGADLLTGQAARRWYWQRWEALMALPPLEAVGRLWGEHIDHLAAIATLLARDGRLVETWPRLERAAARRLLERLAEHTGVAALAQTPRPTPTGVVTITVSEGMRRRWLPTLAGMPPDHPAHRLATALVVLESRPTALSRQPEAALGAVAAALTEAESVRHHGDRERPSYADGPAPAGGDSQRAAGGTAPALAEDDRAGNDPNDAPEHQHTAPKANVGHSASRDEAGALDDTPGTSSPGAPSSGSEPIRPDAQTADPPLAGQSAEPAPQRATDWAAEGELVSEQAGLFYLVNALNQPVIAHIVDELGGWDQLPGGWAWLYRLGRVLDLHADDPLAAFMAGQLGMDTVAELETLPSLPGGARLSTAMQAFYGELWEPRLIQVPGRLHHTASHLDLLLPMDQVRIEVRAAGLDVNPGWVPWLGRVVTFHYQAMEVTP